MSIFIEQYVPDVAYNGLNTQKDVNFSGNSTFGTTTINGTAVIGNGFSIVSSGTTVLQIGAYGTGTVAGGSVVINATRGLITTGSQTAGTGVTFTFDLVNNRIGTSPQIFFQVYNGTNTGGPGLITNITKGTAGSIAIVVQNVGGGVGTMNGTILLDFELRKS